MGKSVTFISDVNGASVSKTRKRMRGDTNKKPEIKIYDPCSEVSAQYSTKTCYCNYARNVPLADLSSNGLYNHHPYRLGYPAVGTGANQRIGNEYFLKYIRLKGMIYTSNWTPCGVRWRLSLIKYNANANTALDVSSYLQMFLGETVSFPTNWGTPGTIANFDATEDGAIRNFYMKIKDVQEWTGWKKKVLASGYVPPNYTPLEVHGTTTGVGETSNITRYDLYTAADSDASVEYQHVQPLDIKITLNDRINIPKYSSIYWLVFEADCGVGFKVDPVQDGRVISDETYAVGSPLKIYFQARAYFTDA